MTTSETSETMSNTPTFESWVPEHKKKVLGSSPSRIQGYPQDGQRWPGGKGEKKESVQFNSVQSLSLVWLFATPWIAARQASLSITNSQSSLRLPSSQWCHPPISSSVVHFSSYPQSLPASESFPMTQLFAWGGQSTGVSALASFLSKKSQGWSPSEWMKE